MKPFRQHNRQRRDDQIQRRVSPGKPSVELHIEELVLRGFSPGDRYAIGDAVELELTRLIAIHGVPDLEGEGFSVDRFDAGSFQVQQDSRKDEVGTKVAESVYRGLKR